MNIQRPHLIVIAGPNGAGKSATAPSLLKGTLGVDEFVNADIIAQGISAFQPEGAAFHAGRVMLERIHYLASKRVNFAFETTLASRTFATWITDLRKTEYDFHQIFLWLPHEEFAVARLAERVRMGGHNVPEAVIRRRFGAGLRNFFQLYKPLSDFWRFYDNSAPAGPRLIASGGTRQNDDIRDIETWGKLMGEFSNGQED